MKEVRKACESCHLSLPCITDKLIQFFRCIQCKRIQTMFVIPSALNRAQLYTNFFVPDDCPREGDNNYNDRLIQQLNCRICEGGLVE